MRRLRRLALDLRTVVNDKRGQDLVEYTLHSQRIADRESQR